MGMENNAVVWRKRNCFPIPFRLIHNSLMGYNSNIRPGERGGTEEDEK